MKQRLVWIDWMKALLISLVVMGHAGMSHDSVLYIALYMFHVPAFFLVSGYLANNSKIREEGFWKSNERMFFAILLWNLILMMTNAFAVYWRGFGLIHSRSEVSFYELVVSPLLGTFFCYYPSNPEINSLCSQMWFVWVLIICRSLCAWMCSSRFRVIVLSLCVLGVVLYQHFGVHTFFFIDRTVAALPFYMLGVIAREKGFLDRIARKMSNVRLLLASLALFTLLFSILYFRDGENTDMFHGRYGSSVLLYYMNGISGTLLLYSISEILPTSRVSLTISEGILFILGTHFLLFYFLSPLNWFLRTLFVLIICYPLILICNRYCRVLLGKKVIALIMDSF